MQTKEYLKQAYRLNELIQSNEKELENLEALSESIPITDFSKERVQSSSSNDARYEDVVISIVDLKAAIKKDIKKLVSLKLEIRDVINEVQNVDEKLLLKSRYLNFMKWEQICDFMSVSMRTVHRIHSDALAHVKIPEKN